MQNSISECFVAQQNQPTPRTRSKIIRREFNIAYTSSIKNDMGKRSGLTVDYSDNIT